MSYTKNIYKQQILSPITEITQKTLDDNNFENVLNKIDISIDMLEHISNLDVTLSVIWNELVSDVVSSIVSATSGLYRQAILSLRSVLELGCSSIFYYDHKIEYKMFMKFDTKADKYVSALVNDFSFFTTKYISTFYEEIICVQKKDDSISGYLKLVYAELSDIVHGRFNKLMKKNSLQIEYNKHHFKTYEKLLNKVLGILCVMYVLRFKDFSKKTIIDLANTTKVVNICLQ